MKNSIIHVSDAGIYYVWHIKYVFMCHIFIEDVQHYIAATVTRPQLVI